MEDIFDFEMNQVPDVAASEINENDDDDLYFEAYNANGKKAFRCTFNNCGKIFKYKSDITRHSLIHSNVRPYFCPYEGCKKSFKRPDVLDGHIRTHTRQLPFECEEPGCNARFTSNAGLKYHLLKHKGQKPFMCTYDGCGRSFMTLAQLKQHESTLKYHKNTSAPTPARTEEEIITKVNVLETKEKKDDSEYFMPKPRAAKTLMWEVKNVDELDGIINEKEPEPEPKNDLYDFERIMSYFVEENKALKQKLETFSTKLGNYKVDDNVYAYHPQYMEAPTSPAIYDLNGFKSPSQVDMSAFKVYEEAPINFFDFMKDGNLSPSMY